MSAHEILRFVNYKEATAPFSGPYLLFHIDFVCAHVHNVAQSLPKNGRGIVKDYRVTIKVRNNRILSAISDVGGTTGQKWCDQFGIGYSTLNNLINMTISPLLTGGEMRPDALKLCDAVNKLPEDLWSREQLYPLEKSFTEMEMSAEEIGNLIANNGNAQIQDLSFVEDEEVSSVVNRVLRSLSERERRVIHLRFTDGLSLDMCGKEMGVNPERVRQIESKAFYKLRHSSRLKTLSECIDLSEDYLRDLKANDYSIGHSSKRVFKRRDGERSFTGA